MLNGPVKVSLAGCFHFLVSFLDFYVCEKGENGKLNSDSLCSGPVDAHVSQKEYFKKVFGGAFHRVGVVLWRNTKCCFREKSLCNCRHLNHQST